MAALAVTAVGEPFATVLAAGRQQFNARVVEARHRYPSLDTEAFSEFLRVAVNAVVAAAHAVAPARVAAVAAVAYDVALELVGQGLAGRAGRSEAVGGLWRDVLPHYARLIAERPLDVLGGLSNAANAVAKVEGARVDEWLNGMAALAARIETFEQLNAVGQVLAWRAGLAHFRAGALGAADRLPEALALAAVGAAEAASWPATRAAFLASPWTCDDARRRVIAGGLVVGRFTGFGGTFAAPPEVKAVQDGFLVASGTRFSFLIADAFGAVLHPVAEEEYRSATAQSSPAPAPVIKGSQLVANGRTFVTGLPTHGLVTAWNAHTIALSSPYSFSIRLVPLA